MPLRPVDAAASERGLQHPQEPPLVRLLSLHAPASSSRVHSLRLSEHLLGILHSALLACRVGATDSSVARKEETIQEEGIDFKGSRFFFPPSLIASGRPLTSAGATSRASGPLRGGPAATPGAPTQGLQGGAHGQRKLRQRE